MNPGYRLVKFAGTGTHPLHPESVYILCEVLCPDAARSIRTAFLDHPHSDHPCRCSDPRARHTAKPKVTKLIGQRTIEDGRATQIQAALIKAGYLSGTPTGHWDAQSEAAMGKLQADNGWQTKLVPDSRALIKLGLGPAADAPPVGESGSESSSIASSDSGSLAPEAR
jgi:hypothetical protein